MLKHVLSVSIVGDFSRVTELFRYSFLGVFEEVGIGSRLQGDLQIRLSVVTSLASFCPGGLNISILLLKSLTTSASRDESKKNKYLTQPVYAASIISCDMD